MEIICTDIPGILILEPRVFRDPRGYFMESWSRRDFDSLVRPVRFVQDNESCSSYGVVRGLHFQKGAFSQSKLVRVVEGTVLDIAVDIRRGSPTFGRHVAVELTAESHRQLFIPRGFAHGFSVLSERAVFQYKCDNYYAPQAESAIAWDDPALAIDWKVAPGDIILSEKDRHHPLLADCPDLFDYGDDLYAGL
jgi:dTDP-4-dehydrorhamnose 3,5-epimerase